MTACVFQPVVHLQTATAKRLANQRVSANACPKMAEGWTEVKLASKGSGHADDFRGMPKFVRPC